MWVPVTFLNLNFVIYAVMRLKAEKQEVYFGKVRLEKVEPGVWKGELEEGNEKTRVRVVLNKTEEAFSKVVERDGKEVMRVSIHTKGIQDVNARIVSASINMSDLKKEMADFNSAVIHIREVERKLPSQLPPLETGFRESAKPLG